MNEPPSTRVLLADGDPLVRTRLRTALEEEGLDVVGEAASAPETVTLTEAYRPQVIVFDLALRPTGGLAPIVGHNSDGARVVLTSERVDLDVVLESLDAGARGVVERHIDGSILARVLRAVAGGELAIPRRLEYELIEHLRGRVVRETGTRPVKSMLTQREWEVLDLLSLDRSTSDIAAELFVTEETVRSHVKHILRKLQVGSRAEAVAVAQSLQGISSAEDHR